MDALSHSERERASSCQFSAEEEDSDCQRGREGERQSGTSHDLQQPEREASSSHHQLSFSWRQKIYNYIQLYSIIYNYIQTEGLVLEYSSSWVHTVIYSHGLQQ